MEKKKKKKGERREKPSDSDRILRSKRKTRKDINNMRRTNMSIIKGIMPVSMQSKYHRTRDRDDFRLSCIRRRTMISGIEPALCHVINCGIGSDHWNGCNFICCRRYKQPKELKKRRFSNKVRDSPIATQRALRFIMQSHPSRQFSPASIN